jgi:hypothetical protein
VVGRRDDEARRLGVARHEGGDVVVGGIASPPAREAHRDAHAAAGRVLGAVEDHRDRLAAGRGERLELRDEAALRRAAVAPPAVRPRAHHVVAVDDPLGHGPHPRGAKPARMGGLPAHA